MRSRFLFPIVVPMGTLLLSCANLSAAWVGLTTTKCSPPPLHASPEEAAAFAFPLGMPEEGRKIIPRHMAAAIQLAMDDFLPPGLDPESMENPVAQCMARRSSYDVVAAPGPRENVVLVGFTLSDECFMGGPIFLDGGATYAVDVQTWRIIAVQR